MVAAGAGAWGAVGCGVTVGGGVAVAAGGDSSLKPDLEVTVAKDGVVAAGLGIGVAVVTWEVVGVALTGKVP